MATKADFTEEEWETLRRGVMGAGLLVSASDKGFFDSFKEAGALAKHMGKTRDASSSELTRALASERGTGFSMRDSQQEIEQETLEALRDALAILEQKAPDESESYRRLVLDVARSVAEAAGGGEEAEGKVIGRLESAMSSAG
jgi:tellurite resistance protein